jgi:hypothetical protein
VYYTYGNLNGVQVPKPEDHPINIQATVKHIDNYTHSRMYKVRYSTLPNNNESVEPGYVKMVISVNGQPPTYSIYESSKENPTNIFNGFVHGLPLMKPTRYV